MLLTDKKRVEIQKLTVYGLSIPKISFDLIQYVIMLRDIIILQINRQIDINRISFPSSFYVSKYFDSPEAVFK